MALTKTHIIRDLFWLTALAMFALAAEACSNSGLGPEETVYAYYKTLTDEDLEKQISLGVPERREQIRAALTRFGFPPGSYANVKVETISQTDDKATVASNYELTTTFQGKTVQGPVEEIFSLEKRTGKWLLASLRFSEPESVEFFVDDEEGSPVGGAKVFVYNDQIGSWTKGVTDSQGHLVFETVRSVDRVWVFKAGTTLANRGDRAQRFLRESHFVTLTPLSVEGLAQSFREQVQAGAHKVQLLTVDPPFLSVPQGSAAQATAVFQSYDLNATVSLTLPTGPRAPTPQITLKPDPDTIEVPPDGQAYLMFTFTVDSSLEPGIYELEIGPEIIEASYSGGESSYSGGGSATVLVEVTPSGSAAVSSPTPTQAVSFEQPVGEPVEFLVHDGAGRPVGGAKVFLYDSESGLWSTGVTSDQGQVVLASPLGPSTGTDNIRVFKAGMLMAREGMPLIMRSVEDHVESIREQGQLARVDILTLDPPFLSVSLGGTAQADVVLQSFGLKATVTLILRTLSRKLVPQMILRSDPATIDIPIDGQVLFPFTLTVAPNVEPGIYELSLNANADITKFRNDDDYAALLSRQGGFSWSGGHTTVIVEVTPPGP